jgi:hypothetical protein
MTRAVNWQDGFFVKHLAEPLLAYRDVLESHRFVTAELETAPTPTSQYELTEERKRLAGIAWAVKRHYGL